MPLTDDEIRFLVDRNGDLKSIRRLYEPLWEEIAEFIFPMRVGIGYKPTPGMKQTTKLYDSTAERSLNDLAASMHGTLTPSSSIWSYFKLRDDRLNRMKEVMDWLELCTEKMTLQRRQSNFTSQVHEAYLDLPGFGQACIFVDEKPITRPGFNGLKYKTIPNSQYCTSENGEGIVDTLFSEFELSARAAVDKFGDELGEKIKDEAKKKPETKFDFIHCVYPREMDFERVGEKVFSSYYISVDDKKLVKEGGFYEFPFIVPRWTKSSSEDYGRGRGHIALPDVKTLNKATEFGLKAWAKDLDPPTFEKDNGVIGTLKSWPGGRNVVRDKDSIWVMDHKIRYDVSQIKEDALKKSIQMCFFADQLNLPEKSDMREMEISVRYELMQRMLGPALGRFESEGLNPLIEREFAILMRASSGRYPVLPPPPPILAQMGITDIDIEYEGPLARSQRRNEMVATQRVAGLVGQMIQVGFDPAILDNFDGDEIARHASEVEGMPSKELRSVEEVAAIRSKRAKIQAEEKQKQDLERLASAAKDVAPIVGALGEQGGQA